MQESNCKECGAKIIFVETLRGKLMPCDAATVYFVADMKKGTENFITTSGVTMRGRRVDPGTKNSVAAYIPHWATCPAAEKFKTAKETPPAAENSVKQKLVDLIESMTAEQVAQLLIMLESKNILESKKQNKPPSRFKYLQELSKNRVPIYIKHPSPSVHEDLEYSYIRDVISRWNEERQGFELFVVLYDGKANSIYECPASSIKVKGDNSNDT